MKRLALIILVAALVPAAGLGVVAVLAVRASLPPLDGRAPLAGLHEPVVVTSDAYGIPTITAESREDAVRALGYVHARDRLFQMDVLRRSGAGRLAEVLGATVRETDIRQRRLGFGRAAKAIVARLPREQRTFLDAYADGVNAYLAEMRTPPFEFLLLGYRPDRWEAEDSVLIVLGVFQMLNGTDDEERAKTVMEQALPPDVVAFLVPETDPYTEALLGKADGRDLVPAIPVQSLAALRRPVDPSSLSKAGPVRQSRTGLGSNGWAVHGTKTADGRSLLANDMHLDVTVPNIWHRAQLRYGSVELAGVAVPGIPVVVAGTNGAVAWGVTNVEGDFLDLVPVDVHPGDPSLYRTPEGWRPFEVRREAITVKGGEDVTVEFTDTIWGPLSEQPLLDRPVAVHWTALDPQAVDLGQIEMDRVQSVADAIAVMTRSGGPANNVLLADREGHIAWTYTGKIPIRRGFDGSSSVSWADGRAGWTGYVTPEAVPRMTDPPSGFVVSANHRMLGRDYPYVIGHSFANGYRAFRISQRLEAMTGIRERDLLDLQLDSASQFYEFYRKVARGLLTDSVVAASPLLAQAREVLDAWNGKAEADSLGFGLVVRFRDVLTRAVFTPFLSSCLERDGRFVLSGDLDTPLRSLLAAQPPELNPDPDHYPGWTEFLVHVLEDSARQLEAEFPSVALSELTWGQVNRVRFTHPLADALPGLGRVLNMPEGPSPGCGQCVRVMNDGLAASQRLVVSPGHPDAGILHMPGGQSGHPFSSHYRDQHPYWRDGLPLPLLAGRAVHTMTLIPAVVDRQPH